MEDVTQILNQIEQGDCSAHEQLLPLVYDELRRLAAAKMAQEMPGQTLQATALVHEAYMRMVDVDKAQHWDSRGHFFAAGAEAMRRILVERARRKKQPRRGGEHAQLHLSEAELAVSGPSNDLLALDEALDHLEAHDQIAAQVVKLRYFAGLSMPQTASAANRS
ncbi:MAG: RNA polymerase subunit sigma [Planctomycetaceae bacterium]|nr:RNA polymerase subunit sigma [Planctomycetaceae bacterium]MCP4788484.1 RNA polymerase subunit sigma [Fuerstiella sp.]MCP4858287.1 RNA polymerase subunit sigma [Fuerstiella sp.]